MSVLTQQGGESAAWPGITPFRYGEDYTFLADVPAGERGWGGEHWEAPLKYVEMGSVGDAEVVLETGAELRLRSEHVQEEEWGAVPNEDEGYLLWRVLPYASLRVGEDLRAFTQLIAADALDRDPVESPLEENRGDILQGFVEWQPDLGSALETSLTVGRQLLQLGDGKLVSARYGPNVPLPFDLGRGRVAGDGWSVDLVYGEPVATRPSSFADRRDGKRSMWSVYTSFGDEEQLLDLYYIGFRDREAAFVQGVGDEERHTFAVRWAGERAGFRWNLEAFQQIGDLEAVTGQGGTINAWSAAADIGYLAPGSAWDVGVKVNVISGDRDANAGGLQTFNPLFPKGRYFGELTILGPRNLFNVHPVIGWQPSDGLRFALSPNFYWRQSIGDGIYGLGGNVIRGPGGSGERFIGAKLELLMVWAFDRHWELTASASQFYGGEFLRETGPDDTVSFFALELRYSF